MDVIRYPQEVLTLTQELTKHPDLIRLLDENPRKDVVTQLLTLAAALDVVVQGQLVHEDFMELAELLTKRMYSRRTSIITLN
jgi:predicted lipid-binding transport protein (Tim44 family)